MGCRSIPTELVRCGWVEANLNQKSIVLQFYISQIMQYYVFALGLVGEGNAFIIYTME